MDEDKPLVWLKDRVKTPPFSTEARLEAGFLLRRLQQGESLSHVFKLRNDGTEVLHIGKVRGS